MYAEVIPAKRGKVTLPFFDYEVPENLQKIIAVGQLVKIPLRGRTDFGIIRSIHPGVSKIPGLKPISEIVTERPFFNLNTLKFLEEISEQYFTSLGLIIKSALPPLQKRKLSKIKAEETSPNQKILPQKPILSIYSKPDERTEHILKNIPEKGQALIVVPEVADAEEVRVALASHIHPDEIAIVSSQLSPKEYFSVWFDVWMGNKKVIIGTRIALFLSFKNLQAIFVDNEAHSSHKSWDSAPRIHARDAALIAGKHTGARVHLLSFMPSLESYYFAEHNVYSKNYYRDLSTPVERINLINLQDEKRGKNFGPISFELEQALKNSRGSIYLYCNRRGSASYVMCRDCAEVIKCKNCSRAMTFHEANLTMECHHCHLKHPMNQSCAKCGGINLAYYGLGTEAIAAHIKRLLPNDKREIVKIEGEKDSLKNLKSDVEQIVIGTQLAWPHLNWNKIGLLAFLDADTPLFVPEFRSAEHLWQLIHEANYRLPNEAQYFIQTNHPEHPVFASLSNAKNFYEAELKNRKAFGYPPYQFLLKIFFGNENRALSAAETRQTFETLTRLTKGDPDIKITPPLELFPPFLKGRYWQAIILKLALKNYKQLSRKIFKELSETAKVDPNPNTLLSL